MSKRSFAEVNMALPAPPATLQASAFRVEIQNMTGPTVTRVRGLRRLIEVVQYREGTDPSHIKLIPGPTTFSPLILWRPKTTDASFEQWAAEASRAVSGAALDRREVVIELLNAAGKPLVRLRVLNCWPSRYDAFNELDVTAKEALSERLTLQYDGWVTELLGG
jgi:phage tail-like protein